MCFSLQAIKKYIIFSCSPELDMAENKYIKPTILIKWKLWFVYVLSQPALQFTLRHSKHMAFEVAYSSFLLQSTAYVRFRQNTKNDCIFY